MRIVIFGLSITSAWGNGHATIYRGLTRALARRGHAVTFFERDVPWYAAHRDLPNPSWLTRHLYQRLEDLETWRREIADADLVIVGSFVPDGAHVLERVLTLACGVRAFYDIDTPVTIRAIEQGTCEYVTPTQLTQLDIYWSFSGGPVLQRLSHLGAANPRPLYCGVDPDEHRPIDTTIGWALGYLGTYSADRQPALEEHLFGVARRERSMRFAVAGAHFPDSIAWPDNVDRFEHLPPDAHRSFFSRQRFTLNLTRRPMVSDGYSPSVRLFEAAACGVPIVSDRWPGLETFLEPGREILVTGSGEETRAIIRDLPEAERRLIASRARLRVLGEHTALNRALELERDVAVLARAAS